MTKPPHTDTIELTTEQMVRGAREEEYSLMFQQWRKNQISDEDWGAMIQVDPDFRAWLWRNGW